MEFMKLLVGVAVFAAGGGYGLAGQPRAPPKGRQANPNNQQQMNGIEELVCEWNEWTEWSELWNESTKLMNETNAPMERRNGMPPQAVAR